ncbi:arsenite efflux ATP-binding protein ArsA [Nocardioides scoriae]|uniref:arsenite-transporting ATPase n=1 Tax=Nocardioides scoriae TaxID=642780 RepID=A0A1H1MNS1_9ACTN|nr:ArsA family ATPase [Nocardioides scoriae]SDR87569.1 arsenite efflux ATP-binding protein ArsA [Nocardioides scoriae]
MSARVVLFTGKGGVGKTTSAAGTAALAARGGRRTLVVSTDAAHSLADAFGVVVGPEPEQVADRLWVHQVDAQRRFERSWGEIQGYLMSVLDAAGVDPITAEELTVIPGAEEVLALLELRRHVLSGRWDVVVVDCAPTAETLRLLALPEALNWYMTRVFGMQRRVVRALRPALSRAAGVPMPDDAVFEAVERLHADLEDVRRILTDRDATVRLVLTPETVVVAEARRSLTTLSLYGYRVDGVVANRVFPEHAGDPWRDAWVASQRDVLAEVRQSFVDLPVWRSAYAAAEPVGVEALAAFARAAYDGADPLAVPEGEGPLTITRTATGAELRIALPFAQRADVDLARHGDELVVTVGSYRRLLALPAALTRHQVAGARVEDGALRVRFRFEQEEQP